MADAAAMFQGRARSDNTKRTYQAGTEQYRAWCAESGYEVFPGTEEQVAEFLAYMAVERKLAPTTIRTRFAGLRAMYRDAVGRSNVTTSDRVVDVLNGIQRTLAEAPKQAAALQAADIRAIIRKLPRERGGLTVQALRDRALLLVMYAGAFRVSEVMGLQWEDVEFVEEGLLLTLRSSKTDQMHKGVTVGIAPGRRAYTCPVRALAAWRDAVGDVVGDVFCGVTRWGVVEGDALSHRGVNVVIRRLVESIGLDPSLYSSHSLRSGIATDLNAADVSAAMVQERTRHKSLNMVGRYHRPKTALRNNFSKRAGL
jgi:site-specific recombinase XerD